MNDNYIDEFITIWDESETTGNDQTVEDSFIQLQDDITTNVEEKSTEGEEPKEGELVIEKEVTDNSNELDNTSDQSLDDLDNELDKELEELTALIEWSKSDIDNKDNDSNEIINEEITEKLTKSIKEINKLRDKINSLELEKAERDKFGEDSSLDPEIIILKANYKPAMEWDKEAISKIKQLMLNDLWLELSNHKEVYVNSAITSSTDINSERDNDETVQFWFNVD